MRFGYSLIIFLLSIPLAHADWQYTRWGMTPEEVMAASGNTLSRCELPCKKIVRDKQTDERLIGHYQTGDFDFEAMFYFDKQTNKLSAIVLKLKDAKKWSALGGALNSKYGAPVDRYEAYGVHSFVWRTDIDQISLFAAVPLNKAPTSAELSYRPRIDGANKGL